MLTIRVLYVEWQWNLLFVMWRHLRWARSFGIPGKPLQEHNTPLHFLEVLPIHGSSLKKASFGLHIRYQFTRNRYMKRLETNFKDNRRIVIINCHYLGKMSLSWCMYMWMIRYWSTVWHWRRSAPKADAVSGRRRGGPVSYPVDNPSLNLWYTWRPLAAGWVN